MAHGNAIDLKLLLTLHLRLRRCPHCSVANPALPLVHTLEATPGDPFALKGLNKKMHWQIHVCQSCAGVVAAGMAYDPDRYVSPGRQPVARVEWIVPMPEAISELIPESVAYYLGQAQETRASASASIVMSASAVDAMLKCKGYEKGTLNERIEKAAGDGVITAEMSELAHDVRLDANDQRHADTKAPRPTTADAQRCFEFAHALADLLFVLPARVKRAGVKPQGNQNGDSP